jgi:hypothetical protein
MRMKPLLAALSLLLAAASPAALAAAACHAVSGATTRPLVELYTSEGCDSCPPADRWLAASFAAPSSPAVPLAFHVDYWDRLGWKDRFGSASNTERQHRAATANRATFVYTPQVLLQGRDLPWRDRDALAQVAAAAARPARAHVEIDAAPLTNGVRVRATARVPDGALRRDAALVVAYVDSGLVSEVKAGENRGARLAHDHVVRAFATGAKASADGTLTAEATFARPREAGRAPAIVAFVQRERDGDVLQALALPLADCPPVQSPP